MEEHRFALHLQEMEGNHLNLQVVQQQKRNEVHPDLWWQWNRQEHFHPGTRPDLHLARTLSKWSLRNQRQRSRREVPVRFLALHCKDVLEFNGNVQPPILQQIRGL